VFVTPQLLRSAASALLAQGALHAELAQVEWAEEKRRLLRMVITLLAGSLCLFCGLCSFSAAALVYSRDTPWQNPVLLGLVLFYCGATLTAWRHFLSLAARGNQAFADTRAELAADLALIRSRLGQQT
jgi:uncharacterized membrane protein YqjE